MEELRETAETELTGETDNTLPTGTEHVVVLTPKGIIETAGSRADRTGDPGAAPVRWEPGDDLPLELARRVWSGFADVLAALDENGERLDRESGAERHGDLDAEAPLRKWRHENGYTRQTVRLFECDECGARFDTKDGLNGHQQVHKGPNADPENAADAATETLAEKLETDGGDGQGGEGA